MASVRNVGSGEGWVKLSATVDPLNTAGLAAHTSAIAAPDDASPARRTLAGQCAHSGSEQHRGAEHQQRRRPVGRAHGEARCRVGHHPLQKRPERRRVDERVRADRKNQPDDDQQDEVGSDAASARRRPRRMRRRAQRSWSRSSQICWVNWTEVATHCPRRSEP